MTGQPKRPALEDAVGRVAEALPPILRKATDDIYASLLESVQDYLVSNAEFNIGSRLDSAERERRRQWDRAETAEAALEAERAKVRECLELIDHSASLLLNISDEIEDEGDRAFFGSTNDADLLKTVARRFDDFRFARLSGEG